jgi:hypothetical protein
MSLFSKEEILKVIQECYLTEEQKDIFNSLQQKNPTETGAVDN